MGLRFKRSPTTDPTTLQGLDTSLELNVLSHNYTVWAVHKNTQETVPKKQNVHSILQLGLVECGVGED